MTGYGKSSIALCDSNITIEIRSLNGKNADISIKTSIIPREKEMEVRQYITKELTRGNIDLFATVEQNATNKAKYINPDIYNAYKAQIEVIEGNLPKEALFSAVIKMPDVLEVTKQQELTDENWEALFNAIKEATAELNSFRAKEGEILYKDITSKVKLIESYIPIVEQYEKERVANIKERIQSKFEEVGASADPNRFEQELIFYIEKLDINEEKVRLAQHCKYFIETINSDPTPGKKLGFIAQEMGREINTLGSKANHAEIQKCVVKMKDELEKIKEQSLNIL